MIKKYVVLFVMMGLVLGMTAGRPLKQDDKPLIWNRFAATLPQGWKHMSIGADAYLVTKDGQTVQQILMTTMDLKQKKEPADITEDIPPQEMAESLMKGTSINGGSEYTMIDYKPAKIGGVDGFRSTWVFRAGDPVSAKFKVVCYWCFSEKVLYMVRFVALEQHYFERDLPVFEEFIGSFKSKT